MSSIQDSIILNSRFEDDIPQNNISKAINEYE